MNFICGKQELLKGINIVSKASSKLQKTILECILFSCADGKLELKATDISLSIRTAVEAEVAEEGEICIPARYLYDIISKFPGEEICFKSVTDSTVEISSADQKIELQSMDPMEFPAFPSIEKGESLKIQENVLRAMLTETVFAAAQSEDRPILTGIMLNIKKNELEIAAVDGFRMAVRTCEAVSDMERQLVIPGRTARELIKIINETENTVKIMATGNMALFETGETRVYSRLLEGEYVKYRSLIPKESKSDVVVESDRLRELIELASVLAREGENNLIKMSIGGNVLQITSRAEIGNSDLKMPVVQKGDDITIGFNAKYVVDTLRAINDKEVHFFLGTDVSPCFVKAYNEKGYEYLILPVKL